MDRDQRFWDRTARRYDASMRVLGGPIPRAVELTADAVRGSARVLEVAAGTGLFTRAVAAVAGEVLATDYAPAMVERLAARVRDLPNVRVAIGDLYALDVEPGSFDAVVAALSRLASRFGFPAHRRFSEKTLAAALERAGLRVVQRELIPGLFPIAFISARHEMGPG